MENTCYACAGVGWYDDGNTFKNIQTPPARPIKKSEGLLSSNRTFSALVGWVVAGFVFWKMYLAGTLENHWHFIGAIVAGCLATWLLRRADWLCTIIRRMVLAAIFCGVLAVVYFYL